MSLCHMARNNMAKVKEWNVEVFAQVGVKNNDLIQDINELTSFVEMVQHRRR